MQAPPPGRRASRHRRGFRSEGSPCADESTVALRLSTPAGELRIRVGQCSGMSPERHGCFMGTRSFRALLPRRLRARVHRPEELRMGSPQYGQLVLDGEPLGGSLAIEANSLLWSEDGGRLAAQELVSWPDGPITRVLVFDVSGGSESPGLLHEGVSP